MLTVYHLGQKYNRELALQHDLVDLLACEMLGPCRSHTVEQAHTQLSLKLLDLQGKSNRVVCYRDGNFVDLDIEEALAMTKEFPEYEYKISMNL